MDTIVIIPTYNEADNIIPLIESVFQQLPDTSVMVVDDNSPDGTAHRVQALMEQNPRIRLLFREKKEGLGRAYLHALKEVRNDNAFSHVVMMDADFSHDPAHLPAFVAAAQNGATCVIGSRYIPGGATEGWELWRMALSVGGNFYARVITGLPIYDMTAGFYLIATDVLRRLDFAQFDSSGYAFQMELKHAAYRAGARFNEVPILFRNRREGESKISNHIIREGLLAPWKIRFKK